MEQSILCMIQSDIQQYISAIASIININIEIMDSGHIRIAGTGIYAENINENTEHKGYLDKMVFSTGTTQVTYNPKEDEACLNCPEKENCKEMFQIGAPVFLNGEIIGAIALIATNECQKSTMESDIESYIFFINQLADLISQKALSYYNQQQMSRVINTLTGIFANMDDGVIVLNNNFIIKNANENAVSKLRLSDLIDKKAEINSIHHAPDKQNEFILKVGFNKYLITGSLNYVNIDEYEISIIIIFSRSKQIDEENTYMDMQLMTDNIIGHSPQTMKIKKQVAKLAFSKSSILITGESGTGKELLAAMIWKNSDRKNKPFIPINCGSIPANLIESELFGYTKGAFTGADPNGKIGKFEQADGGIIFLDEIGDMPVSLQASLLRVLQEKTIMRIGSGKQIKIDVRIIAATNKDLPDLISKNLFREDLYYRLNVIPLRMPPLRNRREDIEVLTEFFIKKYSTLLDIPCKKTDRFVTELFKSYSWPGNVRELENAVEYSINMSDGNLITLSDIPSHIMEQVDVKPSFSDDDDVMQSFCHFEKKYIERALQIYGTSTKSKLIVAKKLGVSMATLYRRAKALGIKM